MFGQDAPSMAGTSDYGSTVAAGNKAQQEINRLSQPTPPAPPVRHATLLSMIHGLAIGLSSAGTAMGTGGREGGAKEVAQIQGEEQQQKLQAQQAAQAAKNAEIQNQIQILDTNRQTAHNILMSAALPYEQKKRDLEISAETQRQNIVGAEFSKSNFGLTPDQVNGKDPLTPQNITNSQGMLIRAIGNDKYGALAILGKDDPSVVEALRVSKLPNPTGQEIAAAGQGLIVAQQQSAATAEAKTKQEAAAANAPFGPKAEALNASMLERYQVSHPGKPLPAGLTLSADSTPKDFDRVDKILQQTEVALDTKTNRDLVNSMRQEQLKASRGLDTPGDTSKTGADYLASLPVGTRGTVKAIGEGRAAPPPAGSRGAAAQSILGALNHAYPDYDATKYPSYLDLRKKFTSGKEAAGINALNTVETHLGRMYDHANAAYTSGGITGRLAGSLGDKDVIALGVDATGVATELAKAYAAGQISEGEKNDWEAKLDIKAFNMTTGKLITNLKEIDGLLESKQKAYQSQWDVGSPSASITFPIINADATTARAAIRGEAAQAAPADSHVISVNGVNYQYNGSGNTADLKNYTRK
jgi:hypothetical protein